MSNDFLSVPGGQSPLRIELADWTQREPRRTRRQVRRHSIAGVIVGGLLVLLAIVGGVARIVERGFSPEVLGALAILAIGGLLCLTGVQRLRWVPAEDPDTPVRFTAPYAFDIVDGVIEFPSWAGRPAESWRLPETSVEVVGEGRRTSVRLSHPAHRSRRFFAHALAQEPATVAAAVEARRQDR